MATNMMAAGKAAEFRRGWPVLLGGSLGLALGLAGLNFYTSGLFVKSLQADFGWTRSQLSAVSLGVTLTVVCAAPMAGLLIDRFGVRIPAAASTIALAIAFAAMGSMNGQLGIFVAIQLLMAAFAVASTPISYSRAVNEHFNAGRGLALGLTLCGTGLAAAFAPPIVAAIIAEEGWRTAYFRLATVVLCATPIVFVLLGVRRGDVAEVERRTNAAADAGVPASYGDMLRDPRFIRLLATFFVLALGVTGFVLHMVPMLTDSGVSPAAAALVQARLGIAVIAGRLVIGALADYFFAPRVAALALCGTIGGIVALAVIGPDAAPISAFAIGFALGAEVDLVGYLTARYFGLQGYGRRYGVLYGSFTLGSGMSPLLIALIAENGGGYAGALWTAAGCVSVAALLLATAPPFPKESTAH